MDSKKVEQLINLARELDFGVALALIAKELRWDIAVPDMDDGEDFVPGLILGYPEYIEILNRNITPDLHDEIRKLGKVGTSDKKSD